MSIVDTWNWDKIDTSEYDKDAEMMDVDMKVLSALYDFENNYGIRPNRIVMGYNLENKLRAMFCPIRTMEEIKDETKGILHEYEGIPVSIDYVNRDKLEVGYVVEWNDGMYE